MSEILIETLERQSKAAREMGYHGWSNTMYQAADALKRAAQLARAPRSETAGVDAVVKAAHNALNILLYSHECVTSEGDVEIPEELSARFDIGLDDARQVVAAYDALALAAADGKGVGK